MNEWFVLSWFSLSVTRTSLHCCHWCVQFQNRPLLYLNRFFFISIGSIVSLLFVKFQIHQPADHRSTLSPPVVKCSNLNSILLHLVSVVQTLSLMFQICRLEALDGARCCCHLVSKLSSIQPPDSSDTSLTLYCTKTSLDVPICCKCVNIVNNNL